MRSQMKNKMSKMPSRVCMCSIYCHFFLDQLIDDNKGKIQALWRSFSRKLGRTDVLYTNTLTYNICVVYWNLNRPLACRWSITHVPFHLQAKLVRLANRSHWNCYRIRCLLENIKQAGDANAGNHTRVGTSQETAKSGFRI